MLYLTRKEHFNAAHRLYNDAWTPEKNMEVFGKCANENFHGHNYELEVTVKGIPDPDTGFLINAKTLSKIIKAEILDRYDHRNLNLDVNDFEGIQPSTENFVKVIWQRLKPHIFGCELHRLRLSETENIFAEYYGE